MLSTAEAATSRDAGLIIQTWPVWVLEHATHWQCNRARKIQIASIDTVGRLAHNEPSYFAILKARAHCREKEARHS